jgi:hypothetical protein
MLSRTLPCVAAVAATVALSLWAWVPAAAGGSADVTGTRYLPIQNISYDLGSKSLSGYFVQQSTTCVVTLMISDKNDPEASPPRSPARVRLALNPGQIAGLDSEEGRSLNVTCGEGATSLLVDVGARADLVAVQERALPKTIAEKH